MSKPNPETGNTKDLYAENLKLRRELDKVKKENDFLKKSRRILRKGTRPEQYHFIDQYQPHFGLRWLLRRFKMCPNAYYNYKKQRKKEYAKTKERHKEAIPETCHKYEGNPGHRMMQIFLARKDIHLSKTTVLKYMQELKTRSVVLRKNHVITRGNVIKSLIIF